MTSTYVNDLRLNEMATGDASGTWGTTTNTNLELIGEALGYGTQQVFGSDANATTTVLDGGSDPARAMYFKVTSVSLSATRTMTIAPATMSRVMFIENATTGSQSISVKQGSGAEVTIPNGAVKMVYLDGAGSGAAVTDALIDLSLGGTLTVGVDGTGHDVKFFGDTSGQYMLWDQSTDELVLAGDSKLSFHDAAGGENIIASADGHLEINAGTTLDITAATTQVNASTLFDVNGNVDITGDVTVNSDNVTFTSANTDDPLITIKQTGDNTTSPRIYFVKDKGAAGADNDEIGKIQFIADNDAQEQISFVKQIATIADASDGTEGGKFQIQIASHDGELVDGLVLTDGSAEDEIDVTIASGSSSATTVSGILGVGMAPDTGVALSISGAVGPTNGSNSAPTHTFYSDPDTGMYRSAANTIGFAAGGTEYVQIGSFGVAADTLTNKTASGGITIDAAGDITLDADGGDVFFKDDGTTFASASSGGVFLNIQNVNSSAEFHGDADRSSADSTITALTGLWNNTAVADVMIVSGDDTTNKDNGEIIFRTAPAGTRAERMRIDSSGRLGVHTTPNSWETGTGGRVPIQIGFGAFSGRLNDMNTEISNNCYATGTGNDPQWAGITRYQKTQIEFDNGGSIIFKNAPVVDTSTFASSPNFTWNERMVLDLDGNLGIGTSSPTGVLDLGAASGGRLLTWAKYANVFAQYSEGSLNLASNYYGNTSSDAYKTSTTANYGAAGIEISGTGGTSNGGIMKFYVDPATSKTADAAFTPTERMTIDTLGRVLIGATTAPLKWWNGTTMGNQLLVEKNNVNTAPTYVGMGNVRNTADGEGPQLGFGKSRGTASGAVTEVDNDDTLGVITFQGADGTNLVEAARIRCSVDNTPGADDMPGRLDFYTTANGSATTTKRMSISSTGKTTHYMNNEDYVLVSANSNGSPYGQFIQFTAIAPDNNTNTFLNCSDTSTTRLIIYSDGDIDNHDNSYGATSDERIKQDIVDANSQWDDIKAVKVRNFKKKDDVDQYGDKAWTQIGVIAQELETVSPKLIKEKSPTSSEIKHSAEFGTLYTKDDVETQDAVLYTSDDEDVRIGDKKVGDIKIASTKQIGDVKEIKENVKRVKYSVLYMKAIKALQEAMTRIETLEAKVTALEGD